jgi:thioesterase III
MIARTFHWKFKVLETHLDTFGHMNHAKYLEVFEQARWELINQGGYGLKKIMKTQIGPTILEAKIQYRRELLLHEEVTIESICTEYSSKLGKVYQRMINASGKEASNLEIIIGLFNMKTRKLIVPTPEWKSALGIKSEPESLTQKPK